MRDDQPEIRSIRPSKEESGRTSIADVAARAKVSIATVSRVLNTPTLVAPATAAAVNEAITTLKYRPNRFARGLVTKKSHVIGISLPDLHGEFYSKLMQVADEEANRLGYGVLVTSTGHRPTGATEASGSGFLLDLIDGMVSMVTERRGPMSMASEHGDRPLVLLCDNPDAWNEFDTVAIDQGAGTRDAVLHLLREQTADRCFFVAGHEGNLDSDARCRVFSETIEEADPSASAQIAYGEFTFEWGREWARKMIKGKRLDGAAVLAGNDEIALGIMDVARSAGLQIPRDLRVIGFDDSRLCRLVDPMLSSVAVPIAAAAREAVRLLVERLKDPERAPASVQLTTTLVLRASS
ncbi:MAG: DNA-binding LacI/PurR family transcriptional regulator [Phycisphaerales bacterium]|jgi:DNA-binding LacI/PurR family transcriptional regulator